MGLWEFQPWLFWTPASRGQHLICTLPDEKGLSGECDLGVGTCQSDVPSRAECGLLHLGQKPIFGDQEHDQISMLGLFLKDRMIPLCLMSHQCVHTSFPWQIDLDLFDCTGPLQQTLITHTICLFRVPFTLVIILWMSALSHVHFGCM